MKQRLIKVLLCLVFLTGLVGTGYYLGYQTKLKQADVRVLFSPKGGCTKEVVADIDAAKSSILVQAYSFTSDPIAEALVRAHGRGVSVQVVVDRSQLVEKYSDIQKLSDAGILVLIDSSHAIAHNKIIIIDEFIILTGSFNFTKAAEEKNAENLLVIKDANLAHTYIENWQRHSGHSAKYFKK